MNEIRIKKPELLAPGGSAEGIRACIAAGADAVYTGGKMFGARAYAQNADEDTLKELIDLCHLYGKKLYLTVNTLLKEEELEGSLYKYLEPLYRHGLDAMVLDQLTDADIRKEADVKREIFKALLLWSCHNPCYLRGYYLVSWFLRS